jgi:flagellar hook-basal body complex protein FliE
MTVTPISGIGAVDPSGLANMIQQFAGGSSNPTSAIGSDLGSNPAAGIGSDLNLSVGTDVGINPSSPAGKAAAIRGADFGSMVGNGLQHVENLDQMASTKAIAAATGDLNDVHDYVIAATEAQTATELTTTLRNKAMDSFNQIMGMSL